jgi:hypothetical protein
MLKDRLAIAVTLNAAARIVKQYYELAARAQTLLPSQNHGMDQDGCQRTCKNWAPIGSRKVSEYRYRISAACYFKLHNKGNHPHHDRRGR